MGQEEILKLLEKEDKPLSRTEIALKLRLRPEQVSASLKILLKHDEIKAVEIDRDIARVKYNCKRRMLLYVAY